MGGEKMKKIIFIIISLLTVLFVMVGCSDKGNSAKGSKKDQSVLQVAGQYPEEHINTESLQSFTDEVVNGTEGDVDFKVYPANSLGDYPLVYEEVIKGTIDMALITLPIDYDEVFESLYINYLAEDYDEAKYIYGPDSNLFKIVEEANDQLGVKFLGFHAEGFTGISTTKEVDSPLNVADNK